MRLLALVSTLSTGLLACSPRTKADAPAPEVIAEVPGDAGDREGRAFADLTRRFLDWYYAEDPIRATRLGLHEWDARLPDRSREAIEARAAAYARWIEEIEGIERTALTGDAYFDHRVLEYAMRARHLELTQVRTWEKHPGSYTSAVAGSISSLSDRTFAPLGERVENMIARMEAAPALLAAGRANLSGVPKVFAEVALGSAKGVVTFLSKNLPAALAEQGFEQLPEDQRTRWARARDTLVAEVQTYRSFIEKEILPNANGDFRLGRELFEAKLRYEEHVDLSADQLREMNETQIERYKAWVSREAARIDPKADPRAVMEKVTADIPTPETLIPKAREYVVSARDFVKERSLLTLPSDELPIVRPTPEYRRQGSFASMSTPGPFETRATEAYYNVTNVAPEWTPEKKRQHLTYFNFAGLLGISIHEAMPGHFVQLLYRQQIPTEVRQVFGSASLVEGWAHYVEQMMLDEGFGGGDPKLRLGQLRRALQRHARWHAGLSMHAFGASLDDAAKRFAEIAYFAEFPARRETRRGAYNPTYLYYALGRMQILELRGDFEQMAGKGYSLREFHDRFLRLGLPVTLAREAMLRKE